MIYEFPQISHLLRLAEILVRHDGGSKQGLSIWRHPDTGHGWLMYLNPAKRRILREAVDTGLDLDNWKAGKYGKKKKSPKAIDLNEVWGETRLERDNSLRTRNRKADILVFLPKDPGRSQDVIDALCRNGGTSLQLLKLGKGNDGGDFEVLLARMEHLHGADDHLRLPENEGVFRRSRHRGDIYLPPDWKHPLIANYSFLFPDQKDDHLHFWWKGSDGQWRPKTYVRNMKSTPVVRRLLLDTFGSDKEPRKIDGASNDVKLTVQLVRDHRKEPDEEPESVIYSFETKDGQLSSRLLSVLDHAQARLRDYTYFSAPKKGGPFAIVRHYILVRKIPHWEESPVFADKTYLQPLVFKENELELYVSRKSRFRPDIELLLREENPDSDRVIETIRKNLRLDSGENVLALVEEGATPERPRFTLLKNGRPLVDMIQPILEKWNPEIHKESRDEAASNQIRRAPETWDGAVKELESLAGDFRDETRSWSKQLEDNCNEIESRLQKAEKLCDNAGIFLKGAEDSVDKAGVDWRNFGRHVVSLEEELAKAPQDWIRKTDDETSNLQRLLEAQKTTTIDAKREVARRLKALEKVRDTLARQLDKLTETADKVGTITQELDALGGPISRLTDEVNEKLGAMERDLAHEESRTREAQKEARQHKVDLERRRLELDEKNKACKALQKANKTEQDRLDREKKRLKLVEEKEIPEEHLKLEEAKKEVKTLESRGKDRELADLQRENTRLTLEITRLKRAKDDFDNQKKRLRRQINLEKGLLEDIHSISRSIPSLERKLASKTGKRLGAARELRKKCIKGFLKSFSRFFRRGGQK